MDLGELRKARQWSACLYRKKLQPTHQPTNQPRTGAMPMDGHFDLDLGDADLVLGSDDEGGSLGASGMGYVPQVSLILAACLY